MGYEIDRRRAALMLAGAAHAEVVADLTGNSHWVFFPYRRFGTECEYRWRGSVKSQRRDGHHCFLGPEPIKPRMASYT